MKSIEKKAAARRSAIAKKAADARWAYDRAGSARPRLVGRHARPLRAAPPLAGARSTEMIDRAARLQVDRSPCSNRPSGYGTNLGRCILRVPADW
jgi:hypothetical protein